MLWSFLPWILFFIAALFFTAKKLINSRFKISSTEEYITFGGFIITYCSLAFSHYQLPHYIFVVFPFAAVITAKYIYQLCWVDNKNKVYRYFYYSHAVLFLLLLAAANLLVSYFFKESSLLSKIFIAVATIVYLYILFLNKTWKPKLFVISVFTICAINIALNTAFYPSLLKYQSGNVAAERINKRKDVPNKFVIYNSNSFGYAFRFYAKDSLHVIKNAEDLTNDMKRKKKPFGVTFR
jgi:hypothetical protein